MKKYFLFLVMTCMSFSACNSLREKPPEIKDGYLDLSSWDLEKKDDIKLDGKWKFYWNRLLSAEELIHTKDIRPAILLNVPGYWTNEILNGQKLPADGFASYRLEV